MIRRRRRARHRRRTSGRNRRGGRRRRRWLRRRSGLRRRRRRRRRLLANSGRRRSDKAGAYITRMRLRGDQMRRNCAPARAQLDRGRRIDRSQTGRGDKNHNWGSHIKGSHNGVMLILRTNYSSPEGIWHISRVQHEGHRQFASQKQAEPNNLPASACQGGATRQKARSCTSTANVARMMRTSRHSDQPSRYSRSAFSRPNRSASLSVAPRKPRT